MTAQLDRIAVVNEDDRVDHRERLRALHHFKGRNYARGFGTRCSAAVSDFLTAKTARWLAQWEYWSKESARIVELGQRRYYVDRNTRYALRHTVGGVGEMAVNLREAGVESSELYGSPPWPWHAMAGLRNRISHYGEVSAPRLWEIATDELPQTVD